MGDPLRKPALPIVFADRHVVVVDKPSGIPSVPARSRLDPPSVVELLTAVYGQLEAAHRLDRDTAGLLVLARTAAARGLLGRAFEARVVRKRYRHRASAAGRRSVVAATKACRSAPGKTCHIAVVVACHCRYPDRPREPADAGAGHGPIASAPCPSGLAGRADRRRSAVRATSPGRGWAAAAACALRLADRFSASGGWPADPALRRRSTRAALDAVRRLVLCRRLQCRCADLRPIAGKPAEIPDSRPVAKPRPLAGHDRQFG